MDIPVRADNGGEKKMIQNVCTHIISKRIEVESPGWSGLVRFLIFYKTVSCVHMYTTFKRIELESPGWSAFEFSTKPDQPGFSSSIGLEVVMEQRLTKLIYKIT